MKTPKFNWRESGPRGTSLAFPPNTSLADGFWQLYHTDQDTQKDIECVAEVTLPDYDAAPEIGDCFDLSGREVHLTLEEIDKAKTDIIEYSNVMAARAEY